MRPTGPCCGVDGQDRCTILQTESLRKPESAIVCSHARISNQSATSATAAHSAMEWTNQQLRRRCASWLNAGDVKQVEGSASSVCEQAAHTHAVGAWAKERRRARGEWRVHAGGQRPGALQT
ncbi:hypothetical protein AAHC03_020661 [Spirometra sp. Aus1]